MTPAPRLLIALLLATVFALSACQMTAPTLGKPTRAESAPPQAPANAPASAGMPTLLLTSAQGRPGETVTISAKLSSGPASIAGTQNDIVFDPKRIAIAAKPNGKPDCTANSEIAKEGTAFSFLPAGCHGSIGGDCTSVRALVLSLSSVSAIPNGSVLYTCKVQISPQASPGPQKLSVSRVGFSNPTGQGISGGGADSAITVGP